MFNNSCFCKSRRVNELIESMWFSSSLKGKLKLVQLPNIFEDRIPNWKRKTLNKMTVL